MDFQSVLGILAALAFVGFIYYVVQKKRSGRGGSYTRKTLPTRNP